MAAPCPSMGSDTIQLMAFSVSWRREPGTGRKYAPSTCAIDATAKWRFGESTRKIPSRWHDATSRLVGKYRPKHEHLRGSVTGLWLIDDPRSSIPTGYVRRLDRIGNGRVIAGGHQSTDAAGTGAGEGRRGTCPGVVDAGR